MKITSSPLPFQTQQVSSKPQFGYLASTKEVEGIKKIAEQHGINSSKINPDFVLINNSHWAPIYNWFVNRKPNLIAMKEVINDYVTWLKGIDINSVQTPFAVSVHNFLTVKKADHYMSQTPETELQRKIINTRKIFPGQTKGWSDDKIRQFLLAHQPTASQKYRTGTKQVLKLMFPVQLENGKLSSGAVNVEDQASKRNDAQ